MDGHLILLGTFLTISVVLMGLGIPLARGRVAPNRLYGFRTPQTLANPNAWYPANRVTGWWCIATGIATAIVTVACHLAEMPIPAFAVGPIVTLIAGILAMVIHGAIVSGRAA